MLTKACQDGTEAHPKWSPDRLKRNQKGVSEITTEQKVIKNKVGLLKLAREITNVSQACKVLG